MIQNSNIQNSKLTSNLFYCVRLIILYIFLLSNISAAQWKKTNGPYSGAELSNIIPNGSDLFGMTNDSIYVSTDNGINWKSAGSGLPDASGLRSLFCLGSNQGSIFAGTFDGVYRSTNEGESWEPINGDNKVNTRITSLGFLDTIIFAGTQSMESSGIYRSTDNGVSWVRVDSFFYNIYVNCFLTKNDTVFAGVDGLGLIRSVDHGETWELLDSAGVSSNFIVGMLIKNDKIYVGTLAGLYCSDNSGESWKKLSELEMLTFTMIGDYLLTGDGYGVGVLISSNEGKTWTPRNNGFIDSYSNSLWVSSLASYNGNLFATTPQGLFISTDTAATWSIVNLRTVETTVYSIVSSNNGTLYAGTEAGFFRSTNKGETWIAASSGLPSYIVYCISIKDSNLFIGTTKGIFRSSNKGNTWLPENNGLANPNVIKAITVHNSDIFAAGSTALYKSTDNGESWNPVNIEPASVGISSIMVDGENILAGAVNGIFRSTDYGSKWEQANTGLSDQHITSLLSVNNKLYAGTYLHGVFSSTNNGDKWSSVPLLSNDAVHSLAAYNTALFVVGTDYGTKIFTIKDSNLVSVYKSGLPSQISIYSLVFQDSILFAGTYEKSVWSCPISDLITAVEKDVKEYSADFHLYQNYPNPFNPSTIIQYQVANSGHVSLKVYDILGREVKTLVNEEKSIGTYKVEFNGEELPSGVYFYRLHAGSFVSTKKFILIK